MFSIIIYCTLHCSTGLLILFDPYFEVAVLDKWEICNMGGHKHSNSSTHYKPDNKPFKVADL